MRTFSTLFTTVFLFATGCKSEMARRIPADLPSDPNARPPMKSQSGVPGAGATPATMASAKYVCPMHSDVVADAPGTCPKCGMTLVKKEGSE